MNLYLWLKKRKWFVLSAFLIFQLALTKQKALAQETQIRGFVNFDANMRDGKINFSLGEQDLFITSQLSDRISFLGETVTRFSTNSPTKFDPSIERIVLNYNYYRNHNILFGKHHTPVNFWNDSYHHGRVFFPTIFRPMMFDQGIIPLHTTGIRLQGQNLGRLRFGYDVLVGNGVASDDNLDLNSSKSFMAGFHFKPYNKWKIGFSYYYDEIPKGTLLHHTSLKSNRPVNQHLSSTSISCFSNKFELLAESTVAINQNDSTGSPVSMASYAYVGYRVKKFVPYVKAEYLDLNAREVLFANHHQTNLVVGLRYEINYLTVMKLEYAWTDTHQKGATTNKVVNSVTYQFAIGF